jgi:hypothetical protein
MVSAIYVSFGEFFFSITTATPGIFFFFSAFDTNALMSLLFLYDWVTIDPVWTGGQDGEGLRSSVAGISLGLFLSPGYGLAFSSIPPGCSPSFFE